MLRNFVFAHENGYFRVTYGPRHGDWIPMLVNVHGNVVNKTLCDDDFENGEPDIFVEEDVLIPMHIASLWCAFEDLIHWLEAVVIGVQECTMEWDAEGPGGMLRWHRGHPGENGVLTVKWYGKEVIRQRIRLRTEQVVGAFYRSFRAFVESGDYDPLRYEKLTVAGVAELVLEPDAMDSLASILAGRGAVEANRLLDAVMDVAYYHHVGEERMGEPKHPRPASLEYCVAQASQAKASASSADDTPSGSWFGSEWDAWNHDQRMADILDAIFPHVCGFTLGGGANLRRLRSDIIENWLAKHEAATRSGE